MPNSLLPYNNFLTALGILAHPLCPLFPYYCSTSKSSLRPALPINKNLIEHVPTLNSCYLRSTKSYARQLSGFYEMCVILPLQSAPFVKKSRSCNKKTALVVVPTHAPINSFDDLCRPQYFILRKSFPP